MNLLFLTFVFPLIGFLLLSFSRFMTNIVYDGVATATPLATLIAKTKIITGIANVMVLVMAFFSGADFIVNHELANVKSAAKIGKMNVGSLSPILNQRKVPCFKKSTRVKA